MRALLSIAFVCCTFLISCKKGKKYKIHGRLLFSSSMQVPVADYSLMLYQSGSGGAPIAAGASSSSAYATTDHNGYFTMHFREGKSFFLFFTSTNTTPASLSSYDNPYKLSLQCNNFPYNKDTDWDPLYLCKKVDTVILKLSVENEIMPTDSFTIRGSNLTGSFEKIKTGMSYAAQSIVNFDTVYNATFPSFDFENNFYSNSFYINQINGNSKYPIDNKLKAGDENRLEFTFY